MPNFKPRIYNFLVKLWVIFNKLNQNLQKVHKNKTIFVLIIPWKLNWKTIKSKNSNVCTTINGEVYQYMMLIVKLMLEIISPQYIKKFIFLNWIFSQTKFRVKTLVLKIKDIASKRLNIAKNAVLYKIVHPIKEADTTF